MRKQSCGTLGSPSRTVCERVQILQYGWVVTLIQCIVYVVLSAGDRGAPPRNIEKSPRSSSVSRPARPARAPALVSRASARAVGWPRTRAKQVYTKIRSAAHAHITCKTITHSACRALRARLVKSTYARAPCARTPAPTRRAPAQIRKWNDF